MSSLDEVLSASVELLDELNPIIDSVQNPWGQCQADWIWFRMHSVVVFLRDRGGGPVAAVLARGLLEQAAYWDWALATGVGDDWVPRQAAFELDRLKQLADSIDDPVWTGWLLPPGTSVNATSPDGIPRSAADAVKRLRTGDDAPCLEPLKFNGLYSVYEFLEVLAHGGFAAAYTLLPGGGEELSEPLAAAVAPCSRFRRNSCDNRSVESISTTTKATHRALVECRQISVLCPWSGAWKFTLQTITS